MARRFEVCRCNVCGNVVEVVHGGDGVLWCCGRPMKVFSEKNVDPDQEDYVPVIERIEGGVRVVVGRAAHSMEEDHHIQWIEVLANGFALRKFLKPGEEPEATFQVDCDEVRARAYCTQHGLCVERQA